MNVGLFFTPARIPKVIRPYIQPQPWQAGYIHGPVGVGKSVLAACRLIGGLCEHPERMALFVSVPELMRDLHGAKTRHDEEEIVDGILGKGFLVLDDVTAPMLMQREWLIARLMLIVNYRASRRLETLVTGEKKPKELLEAFGESLCSRLESLGPVECLEGPDRRLAPTRGYPENEPFLNDLPAVPEPPPPLTQDQARSFGGRLDQTRAGIAAAFDMAGFDDVWLELASDWAAGGGPAEFARRLAVIARAVRSGKGDIWELLGKDRPGWWWPADDAVYLVVAVNLGLPPGDPLHRLVLEDERELIGVPEEKKNAARKARAAAFEKAAAGKKLRVR